MLNTVKQFTVIAVAVFLALTTLSGSLDGSESAIKLPSLDELSIAMPLEPTLPDLMPAARDAQNEKISSQNNYLEMLIDQLEQGTLPQRRDTSALEGLINKIQTSLQKLVASVNTDSISPRYPLIEQSQYNHSRDGFQAANPSFFPHAAAVA